MKKIISLKKVSFSYKKKGPFVLRNASLDIFQGEIFGLLGLNGSGKTTLVNILSTLFRSFTGEIFINNLNLKKDSDKIKEYLGVLFQDAHLDEDLTGYHFLDFYAQLYGVSNKADRKKSIFSVAGLVDMRKPLSKRIKTYSEGMKRRLELARCFLNKSKILLLDEPTRDLDQVAAEKIWRYLKKLNQKCGVTILITTNYTKEVEFLCDRAGIITDGHIDLLDFPLKQRPKLMNVFIKLKSAAAYKQVLLFCREKSWIKNLVNEYLKKEICLEFTCSGDTINELLSLLFKFRDEIINLRCGKPDFNSFLKNYWKGS